MCVFTFFYSMARHRNHRVDEAENGRDAVDKVRTAMLLKNADPYNVILMDYEMPILKGPDAVVAIRENGTGISITAAAAAGSTTRWRQRQQPVATTRVVLHNRRHGQCIERRRRSLSFVWCRLRHGQASKVSKSRKNLDGTYNEAYS
jgi:CheY-like chemotaxis protein